MRTGKTEVALRQPEELQKILWPALIVGGGTVLLAIIGLIIYPIVEYSLS